MQRKNGNEIKSEILRVLEQNQGLTITDVSRVLDLHYSTASKYLAVLEAQGLIFCRQIGMAKMFLVKANGVGNSNSNGVKHE